MSECLQSMYSDRDMALFLSGNRAKINTKVSKISKGVCFFIMEMSKGSQRRIFRLTQKFKSAF